MKRTIPYHPKNAFTTTNQPNGLRRVPAIIVNMGMERSSSLGFCCLMNGFPFDTMIRFMARIGIHRGFLSWLFPSPFACQPNNETHRNSGDGFRNTGPDDRPRRTLAHIRVSHKLVPWGPLFPR